MRNFKMAIKPSTKNAKLTEQTLPDLVLDAGELATHDLIMRSMDGIQELDPHEVASLVITGLRYIARGAQAYDPAGKQENHDEIASAKDLLNIYKSKMKASNWWDLKRIDGAVVTFVNLGCMPYDEGNDWFKSKLHSHSSIVADITSTHPVNTERQGGAK